MLNCNTPLFSNTLHPFGIHILLPRSRYCSKAKLISQKCHGTVLGACTMFSENAVSSSLFPPLMSIASSLMLLASRSWLYAPMLRRVYTVSRSSSRNASIWHSPTPIHPHRHLQLNPTTDGFVCQ